MTKNRTYDCDPTMTDSQVWEFCRDGLLVLEGVVPHNINQRTIEFFDQANSPKANLILAEDWFVDNVILNRQAMGVVRSLLGRDFELPRFMTNHRNPCPGPAQHWHRDGGSIYGPKIDCLQVFYYPQDTPLELGPTEVMPGSHFLFSLANYMDHYQGIADTLHTAAPAGSIFVTIYHLWHRTGASTATGIRNLLKYWYTRTVEPQRDWIVEDDFDIESTYNMRAGHHDCGREMHRTFNDTAEVFFWLSGRHGDYRGRDSSLPVYLR